MESENIKRLLRIAVCQQPDIDATLTTFYMLGINIVNQETYKTMSILPAIAYVPPNGTLDMDEYWSVAVCTGSIFENCITTFPFSFRPWKLRYVTPELEKNEMYALIMVTRKLGYNVPEEILRLMYYYLTNA